jgi:hypothetical protein
VTAFSDTLRKPRTLQDIVAYASDALGSALHCWIHPPRPKTLPLVVQLRVSKTLYAHRASKGLYLGASCRIGSQCCIQSRIICVVEIAVEISQQPDWVLCLDACSLQTMPCLSADLGGQQVDTNQASSHRTCDQRTCNDVVVVYLHVFDCPICSLQTMTCLSADLGGRQIDTNQVSSHCTCDQRTCNDVGVIYLHVFDRPIQLMLMGAFFCE